VRFLFEKSEIALGVTTRKERNAFPDEDGEYADLEFVEEVELQKFAG